MKNLTSKCLLLLLATALPGASQAKEKLIIVNEGLWQADNGRLSYFEDGKVVSNKWFEEINGSKIGDTPNDIIEINPNLIAIAVNWSNIVQFITPEGKAVAATEDIPNNRKLATDGRYLYVSSYGHEVGINGSYREFDKGYVAKIDVNSFKVVDAVEVGYEPEGIAYYDGHLFVANTGGYAFQENHEYETTVSVIDAAEMKLIRNVDTGQINLYGKMSQSGRYLCINSPGDYYEMQAATIIFDCDAAISGAPDADCCQSLEYAATYNTVDTEGNFYAIGSRFSYYTGEYEFNYVIINPQEVMKSKGAEGVYEDFPGTVADDLLKLTMPYGIYVNPYTGYIYATDAGSFAGAGTLYQWTPEGQLVGEHRLYINPAHFLALNPNPKTNSKDLNVQNEAPKQAPLYNVFGLQIHEPLRGQIYIQNGKKFIYK